MQTQLSRRHPATSVFRIWGTLLVTAAVLASASPASGSEPPGPPSSGTGQLTPEQVAAFADVVDDSESRVKEHLGRDPGLAPLALQAVDARHQRKTAGAVLAGIGIAIFVLADIAGTVIIVTTPGYPKVLDTSRVLGGLAVDLVGFGVGAALAIPGFIKVGKSSDEESKAADYYREEKHNGLFTPSPLLPGEALRVPLVSLSF